MPQDDFQLKYQSCGHLATPASQPAFLQRMEQPALLSPCTPRGADLFQPTESEAPFTNVAFNPRHRRAPCTHFPGCSKGSSQLCPPVQQAPALCPKATALSQLVITAHRAPQQQQPGGIAHARPVPVMKHAGSTQESLRASRQPALLCPVRPRSRSCLQTSWTSHGFQAARPKGLAPSCRTGFAEAQRMKLSLSGFGYVTKGVLAGPGDPACRSLPAQGLQVPQRALRTGRAVTLSSTAASKAGFVGRGEPLLGYQTDGERPNFRYKKRL